MKSNRFSLLTDSADLHVTYMDGHCETIPGVRYQCSLDEPDPIIIDGTTVKVETDDGRIITMVGVRRIEFL